MYEPIIIRTGEQAPAPIDAELLRSLHAAAPDLLEACRACDRAFCSWQLGQIPGRPADILALITQVRAAIAKAEGGDK